MKPVYRSFFGLTREPFSSEITGEEILQTPDVIAVSDRFDYAIRLGAMALVTGEVGSGKSPPSGSPSAASTRPSTARYGSPPHPDLFLNSTANSHRSWRSIRQALPGRS
jgi:hypothetical protein